MMIRKNQTGFTLIELIVVIGVIAILSAMIIAILNPLEQFAKARDSQRKSDLSQIQKALEQYYQDTGSYPNPNASYEIIGINSGVITWGTSNTANWPYMNVMPKDPENNRSYVYYSTGQSYWLYTALERGKQDPQACNNGNACSEFGTPPAANPPSNPVFPSSSSCGNGDPSVVCNYGVSSPNTSP